MKIINSFLSQIISRIKKEDFIIDVNYPSFYLGKKLFSFIGGFLSGLLMYRKRKLCLGYHSRIIYPKKLKKKGVLLIDRYCIINAISENGIIFGSNCSIGKYTCIECTGSLKCLGKGLTVGNNCGLGANSFYGCAGGIKIGNDVIVGNFVSMHSENHNFSDKKIPIRLQGVNHKGIKIGNNCWIGAKATILDGTVIGDGCIIAAGSVVRGNFPDDVVIGGVPAKILRQR
jgi:acetyltransferase-like isoleucine patch superfamily enzyme